MLAVAGDGGFLYSVAELASARQNGLGAKLLLVDDGGYGILREYQQRLVRRDVRASISSSLTSLRLAEAFGVPVRGTAPERLGDDLAWALSQEGPAVVVLRTKLEMWTPTA